MLMTNNDGDDEDRNEPRELGEGAQGMGMEMGPPIGQVFRNAS